MKTTNKFFKILAKHTPLVRAVIETNSTSNQVTVAGLFMQKLLGFNRNVPWPVHFTSVVSGHQYIKIGYNTAPGISIGNYIFATQQAPITIGNYCAIASNVCIGSVNHNTYDISSYETKGEIKIGDYCWIGANAVILSGVILGDHTTVAAGSVVNKSFPDGYCIIAGVPARIVKRLEINKCVKFHHKYIYRGYKRIGSRQEILQIDDKKNIQLNNKKRS